MSIRRQRSRIIIRLRATTGVVVTWDTDEGTNEAVAYEADRRGPRQLGKLRRRRI